MARRPNRYREGGWSGGNLTWDMFDQARDILPDRTPMNEQRVFFGNIRGEDLYYNYGRARFETFDGLEYVRASEAAVRELYVRNDITPPRLMPSYEELTPYERGEGTPDGQPVPLVSGTLTTNQVTVDWVDPNNGYRRSLTELQEAFRRTTGGAFVEAAKSSLPAPSKAEPAPDPLLRKTRIIDL